MANNRRHSAKNNRTSKSGAADVAGDATSKVLDKVGFAANIVGQGVFVGDMLLPLLGGAVGWLGFRRAEGLLKKPSNVMQNTKVGRGTLSSTMLEGSFVVGSGLEMFGVARSYSQKVEALRTMYIDMTGKKPKNLLSDKDVPAAVAEARSHLLKEHGIRGVLSSLGGALSLRSLLKGGSGTKTMIAWMVLPFASEGVNLLMGEAPVLHVYQGLRDAHQRGEAIPAKTYADLILAASKELQARGATGKELAERLAEQYAALNAAPAAILNEVENGRMMQRIKTLMASGEVSVQPAEPAKLTQALDGKQEQPVVGPETAKLMGRREAADPSPVLGV